MLSHDAASQHDIEAGGVCRLSPLDPALLLNAGNRLCEQERFEEAVAVYSAALSLSPAGVLCAMILSNLGMAHLEMQQAESALTDFDAAFVALAALPPGQSDAALLEEMHRIALAGKAQAQARKRGLPMNEDQIPTNGPDLLAPPHVVPALMELFAGDKDQALAQQETIFAHLVTCQYCRIAVMVLLGVAQEYDRRNQEPEDVAHELLLRFAAIDRKIGEGEAQRYERLAVYAEAIVAKGRGEAAALFPELAAHLDACSDCRSIVEETVAFLREASA